MNDYSALLTRFNDCINTGDVGGLAELMSDEHTFIDTGGVAIRGKDACLNAWRGFFLAHPTYRNVFVAFSANDEAVSVSGYSVCPGHPELDGPALWSAVIRGGRFDEWRVYEDTPEARRTLSL
ncbi:nuclear transport factor 2 family protein [Pseudarthrobacter sp. NS4]|uniref:nuclear transport factor 2 family protein n=1 Tax=Pseudarthrobacter sp. NS4 TaxID=2973976 RepID=UPI0021638227|nr:nuclear transport factor 2 family protein [Pseudarthrobacter sp. NS4]